MDVGVRKASGEAYFKLSGLSNRSQCKRTFLKKRPEVNPYKLFCSAVHYRHAAGGSHHEPGGVARRPADAAFDAVPANMWKPC